MNNDAPANAHTETVEEETINAYRVQQLADGRVRIKSGGHVVVGRTYFGALEAYAVAEQRRIDESAEHLREEHRNSIYDGPIPLRGGDSNGFTPEQILDAVTGQPLESVLADLAQNMDHDELCWCHECEVGPIGGDE